MAIENITDELLAEILHRLPFVFLLMCKCVSKRFLHVISDVLFLRSHPGNDRLLHHAFENPKSFLFFHFLSGSSFEKIMLFSLDSNNRTHILRGYHFLPHFLPRQDFDRVRVKASHLDLVLCSTHNNQHTHYFVCNPFTKQYVALPPISRSAPHEMAGAGFLYDKSKSRFAVIHIPIISFVPVSSFRVNLFLSHTGEWSSFTVTMTDYSTIMANTFYKNILVYDGKFVWWIKEHGFFVCDPFNAEGSMWRIVLTSRPWYFLEDLKRCDIYNGICNEQVRVCIFSQTNVRSRVHKLEISEQGRWRGKAYGFDDGGVRVRNMKLLALHPQNESMVYFYSKKTIFLCDYENQRLESVYTSDEEDVRVLHNVMSLVLPGWPTVIPTLP